MMKQEVVEGSLTGLAHELIADVVKPGEVAVDATVGNGHDTLFLTKCAGADGRVIGFDLQREAVDSTRARLAAAGIPEDVYDLHALGHQRMADYVPAQVAAVMFNLGYLPGGDKGVITQMTTTLEALDAAFACLRRGGALSVMCYPGHPGGGAEAAAVVEWMGGMLPLTGELTCYQRAGARETTPFLLVAKRR